MVADLPKTFRDAVSLCRYLGIPYLWIDSLCIIQGDAEDWARESSRMLDVYSNAYLVIATNHANDSAGGCFHIRPSRIGASLTIPGIGLVHAQLGANSDEFLVYNAEFSDEPLTKRAWALQERLHGIVGEDGSKVDRPYCDLSALTNQTCSAQKALQTWSSIVGNYSDRNLTNSTDKFPGLSGFASLLGDVLKDEYMAGLWSSEMVQGLACWSWASLQGTVGVYDHPNWRSIAIVEGWKIELTNPDDHYGQVKSASVRVRGPLTQLTPSTIPGIDLDERLKRAGVRPNPRFCTKYSGESNDMPVMLDNRDPNACDQWQDMEIKVLLLGGHGGASSVSPCEVEGEQAEAKNDNKNREFEIDVGFGIVLSSEVVNGAMYKKRIGWAHLDRKEAEKLMETKEDWDTITII
ncbi:hypothetical protein FBULB1_14341 [Fusarium bulbicola]|nr:hypothetical protein FBULB1_14341 [Fusarium bulbicola]